MLQVTDDSIGASPVLEVRFVAVAARTMADFISFRQRHATFAVCSCMRHRMTVRDFAAAGRKDRARRFDALVAGGVPVGILALVDDVPMAWCSVAPRETFPALQKRGSARPAPPGPVWAVTCFFVDYRFRRQGMTVRLLRAAVDYARAAGARVVEGHPCRKGETGGPCAGTLAAFRGAGFRRLAVPKGGPAIMQNIVG